MFIARNLFTILFNKTPIPYFNLTASNQAGIAFGFTMKVL